MLKAGEIYKNFLVKHILMGNLREKADQVIKNKTNKKKLYVN
jgi:hypothetical protein